MPSASRDTSLPTTDHANALQGPAWTLLLACVGIVGVCVCYMLSPPEAVMLTRPFDLEAARLGALEGATTMRAASAFAIPGNMLFAAAAFRIAGHRTRPPQELEALGWWLAGLSGAHFTVVDRMVGLVLPTVAARGDAGAFLVAKTTFDMLFVAGTLVYGLGTVLVSRSTRVGRPLSVGFVVAGIVACGASVGCFFGAPVGRLMGLGILLDTLMFGALGLVCVVRR
jgi:hypothetical protein